MELSLTKLFGGSRYLIQSIHAKKLQVRIFSRLGLKIQDNALTISKKSRSDVQHHNHTQIICIIVVLKVLKLLILSTLLLYK